MANYNNNFQRNPHRGGADRQGQSAEVSYNHILCKFDPKWIINEIDRECVIFCEEVAKYLADQRVSSSLLRNIYGELKRIEAKGFAQCRVDFFLMRPKIAYTVARSDKKDYAQLFNDVYNKMANCVTEESHFDNLVSMCEAIIAYHKTYNPK